MVVPISVYNTLTSASSLVPIAAGKIGGKIHLVTYIAHYSWYL